MDLSEISQLTVKIGTLLPFSIDLIHMEIESTCSFMCNATSIKGWPTFIDYWGYVCHMNINVHEGVGLFHYERKSFAAPP